MTNEVTNGPELASESWTVLQENRRFLWFPVISISLVLVLVPASVIFLGVLGRWTFEQMMSGPIGGTAMLIWVVLLVLCIYIVYTCVIFVNVALVAAVMKLMRGEPASVTAGFRIALSKLFKILVYAAFASTVGVAARIVGYFGLFGGLFTGNADGVLAGLAGREAIQGGWNRRVFLAIPVMIAENGGAIRSIRRGASLFKETWDEDFKGNVFVRYVPVVVYIASGVIGGLVILYGIKQDSGATLVFGVILLFVILSILFVVDAAVNGVFQAAMYQYATTGDAGPYLNTEEAADAFWTV